MQRLNLFHVNDSVREQGSHVDRLCHVGCGKIGVEAFRYLVNDPRFRKRPMILETPKEAGDISDMDTVVNLLGVAAVCRGTRGSTEKT